MMKPVHARMARAALKWSVLDLQQKAGLNKNTIVRFESGKGILLSTATRLEETFAKSGIEFIYEGDARGPGIMLSKELSRRIGETANSLPKTKSTQRRPRSN